VFYLPPSELWYFAVARLTVLFDDSVEEFGTGFFVDDGKGYSIVTARHVVDTMYRPPDKKRNAICAKISASFLLFDGPGSVEKVGIASGNLEIKFPTLIFDRDDNDCAVVRVPAQDLPLVEENTELRPYSFSKSFIATSDHLAERHAGEPVLFIGYPRNSPVHEYYAYDKAFEHVYPLLRQGVLAFPTSLPVRVDGFLGKNYGVLDSFAQRGFSGAPLISLQKGWADGSWHAKELHRPPRVLGVVCGHYRSTEDRADGVHSGLSYFVRATSIHDCLEQ
jgi:hypothetical protein